MGVRLKQQMQNALQVARWLASRPEVLNVLYPALPAHPGHQIWKRDFRGAASLFSVVLKPEHAPALNALVDSLQLFAIGSSWGGYESLVNVVRMESCRSATPCELGGPAIRLHIGLEDPADLIADLSHAFSALRR